MHAGEIAVGMRVRYPRTGTTGVVERIELSQGAIFAELDNTHLRYRVDELVPADLKKERSAGLSVDAKQVIEREWEYASGSEYQEALKNIDQSCEGGG
jgi:hypothetical protein